MVEINDADDFDSFLQNNKKGIVFFGSLSCGHCRSITPYVQELVKQYPDIGFAHVETSRVRTNNLKGVPVFCAYKNGQAVDKVVGANKPALQSMIATKLR